MIFGIVIVLLTAFAVVADIFDVTKTVEGIKMGVGIEANGLITTIARTDRPSAAVLYAINLTGIISYALVAFAGLLFTFSGYVGLAMTVISIAALAITAVKHIQGGRQWIWMMKNPTLKLPVAHTAWEQFCGVWV